MALTPSSVHPHLRPALTTGPGLLPFTVTWGYVGGSVWVCECEALLIGFRKLLPLFPPGCTRALLLPAGFLWLWCAGFSHGFSGCGAQALGRASLAGVYVDLPKLRD